MAFCYHVHTSQNVTAERVFISCSDTIRNRGTVVALTCTERRARGVGALDVFRSGVWLDFSFRPVEKTKEGPSWGRHLQLECFAGRRCSKETGGREEAQVRSPPAHCLGRKHTEAGSRTKNTHDDFFFFFKFGCFPFVLKLHSSAGRFHAFCCCWKSV